MTGPQRRAQRLQKTARAAELVALQAAGGRGLEGITRRAAHLAQVLRSADHARADALFASAAPELLPHPPLADWVWRPDLWQQALNLPAAPESGSILAPGVKLFHDGGALTGNPTLTQAAGAQPPHPLDLQFAGFDGGYVSLVFDLPKKARAGLLRRHLIGIACRVRGESALAIVFARINVVCGPNRFQAQRRVPVPQGGGAMLAEFDMQEMAINERRLDAVWCDLVFSNPADGAVRLYDLILYRRPRAGV